MDSVISRTPYPDRLESEFYPSFLKDLSKTITDLSKKCTVGGIDTEVFLNPNYSETKVFNYHFESDEIFLVNTDFLQNLLREHGEPTESGNTTVEEVMTSIKINGYLTSAPTGKSGKAIELSSIRTTTKSNFIESISKVVKEITGGGEVLYHGAVHSKIRAVAVSMPVRRDAVLLVVGAKKTNIFVLDDSALVFGKTITFGHLDLNERVAGGILTEQEAESLQKIHKINPSNAHGSKSLTFVKQTYESWYSTLRDEISQALDSLDITSNYLYICSTESENENLVSYFRGLGSNMGVVGALTGGSFAKYVKFKNMGEEDSDLLLATSFCATLPTTNSKY